MKKISPKKGSTQSKVLFLELKAKYYAKDYLKVRIATKDHTHGCSSKSIVHLKNFASETRRFVVKYKAGKFPSKLIE